MRNNLNQPKDSRVLAVSIGGFVVFSSILFLFERLGVFADVLIWALCLAIAAIAILLSLHRGTLSAERFFVSGRQDGVVISLLAGVANITSVTIVLIVIAGVSTGTYLMAGFLGAVIAGLAFGGLLFARALRASSAWSVANYLQISKNSRALGFISALVVCVICLLLLYTEIKLAGLFLAPVLNLTFGQVTGFILILAVFVSLAGGLASASFVQTAFLAIFLVMTILPALWFAGGFFGLPLPQIALFQSFELSLQPLVSGELLQEIQKIVLLGENSPLTVLFLILAGFAALPHFLNRHLAAISAKSAVAGHIRAVPIAAVILSALPILQLEVLYNIGEREGLSASPQTPLMLKLFMWIAILVAAISTISQLLVTIANTLAHDVFRRILVGKKPGGRELFIARLVILTIAAGIWPGSDQVFSAASAGLWALVISVTCLLPTMLLAAYTTNVGKFATLSGMIISVVMVGSVIAGFETGFGQMIIGNWLQTDAASLATMKYWVGIAAMPTGLAATFLLSLGFPAAKNPPPPIDNPFDS